MKKLTILLLLALVLIPLASSDETNETYIRVVKIDQPGDIDNSDDAYDAYGVVYAGLQAEFENNGWCLVASRPQGPPVFDVYLALISLQHSEDSSSQYVASWQVLEPIQSADGSELLDLVDSRTLVSNDLDSIVADIVETLQSVFVYRTGTGK
jgi:hypothetical protein